MQAQVSQHQSCAHDQRQFVITTSSHGTLALAMLAALPQIGRVLLTHLLQQLPKLLSAKAGKSLDERRMIAQTLLGEHGSVSSCLPAEKPVIPCSPPYSA
jgi:hypothetical protein